MTPWRFWTKTAVRINLIIVVRDSNCYLISAGNRSSICPVVPWPQGFDRLGGIKEQIEAMTAATVGVKAELSEVLAFMSPDLYVTVVVDRTTQFDPAVLRSVSLPELERLGVHPELVELFRLADDRNFARVFARDVGLRIRLALARSAEFLLGTCTEEDGRVGWSETLRPNSVGVLSSAQGLLALLYANVRSRCVLLTAHCLEQAQNRDGGWQVRHALSGEPSGISIAESTCYCLEALLEAGWPDDDAVIASGAGWLLANQRKSGGWASSDLVENSQVVPTALAIRALARLDYPQTVAKVVNWLLSAQLDNGGWPFSVSSGYMMDRSSVAATAHAVISLVLANVPADHPSIARAGLYLRRRYSPVEDNAPWTSSSSQTHVAEKSGMTFRHYATPWAIVALIMTKANLGDPLLQRAFHRFLQQQEADGAWVDPAFGHQRYLWAAHDAVFALKTVMAFGTQNLAPMITMSGLRSLAEALESIVLRLIPGRSRRGRRASP